MKWAIVAEVGCDNPEVFGPFELHDQAVSFVDTLGADERVLAARVQAIIPPASVEDGNYFELLDEILEES